MATEDPIECRMFLSEFSKVWSPSRCLVEFGFQGHPQVLAAVQPDGEVDPKYLQRLAESVVDRTNAYDQSSELPAVDKEDGADESPGGPADDSSGAVGDPSGGADSDHTDSFEDSS